MCRMLDPAEGGSVGGKSGHAVEGGDKSERRRREQRREVVGRVGCNGGRTVPTWTVGREGATREWGSEERRRRYRPRRREQ